MMGVGVCGGGGGCGKTYLFLRFVGGCVAGFAGEFLVRYSTTTRQSRSTLAESFHMVVLLVFVLLFYDVHSACILSAPWSPMMPNPIPRYLIHGTMWSSKRWSDHGMEVDTQ